METQACPSCGIPVYANAAVCSRCGARIFAEDEGDWMVPPRSSDEPASPPRSSTGEGGSISDESSGSSRGDSRQANLIGTVAKYGGVALLVVIGSLIALYLLWLGVQA